MVRNRIWHLVESDDPELIRDIAGEGAGPLEGRGPFRVRFQSGDGPLLDAVAAASERRPKGAVRYAWAGPGAFGEEAGRTVFAAGRPVFEAEAGACTREAMLLAEAVTGTDVRTVYEKASKGLLPGAGRGLSWFASLRDLARERMSAPAWPAV